MGGAQYKSDNLTETVCGYAVCFVPPLLATCFHGDKSLFLIFQLFINTFTNYENMLTFIKQNIMQFEFDGTSGVILALYSVILSRSVEG